MSFLGISLGLSVGKTVGTVLAGTGLLLGAATGVHALTSDSPTPSASAAASGSSSAAPSCGKGIKKPQALREAAKAARALPAGPKRAAARAAIKKDVLAGKYGTALKERAETRAKNRTEARADARRDARSKAGNEGRPAAAPALTAARKKVAAMPKGDARREAAEALHKDVLAGKYGAAAKSYAEQRAEKRDQARKDLHSKVKEHRETCAQQSKKED